ncbi:serine/threonine-protein kinase LMTK1 [Rhea pennata]|uniref:serine/threonine-protein kinase LMTK1 n=1 Tax=Rhea pennata TaxID=8795 RepID=UPI002E2596F2
MLACLCCKKGDIGFKEFENAEGEDYAGDFSAQGSPAPQHGPEVYVLPLTEVSLPMAKQPGRSVQLLKSADLGRQSLLYLKEIGHGWFGKVFLGEVNSGLSSTQVVVKELKASASVQDQMQFLEEAQPYRALQHTNLLQCLAQCAEVTPYLLVMEFCPLGDLKGYLRSCRGAESMAPDPLTLQRMACEVACGVLHLHRNNYIHSDLALRNCLLTADLTVKIGDYGLSHCKYKDDYFVTADQLWVPLRWIAPELIDEVHGNLLIVDQTKSSNVWSLGVTIWELFELGSQPYDHYSDRQVLAYAIKEQQLKLPKPQLKLSLSDRWYEVMQFCWLQPEQRPTAEEVHLLLSYLCAKGATEAEEEFEKRWNSMKPNGGGAGANHAGAELSSFPLLEQFVADGFPADGDDVLTVMETSHGLNFEYKWEHTKTEHFQAPLGALSPGSAARYRELYYPAASAGRLSLGLSPPCYACERQGCPGPPAPGVVPVLGARSPSLSSEYYIRIEGPAELGDGSCSPAGRGAMEPAAARHRDWPVPGGRRDVFADPLGVSPSGSRAGRAPESPPGRALAAGPLPAPRQPWASNSSSNNNSGGGGSPPARQPAAGDSWCYRHMITFRGLMAKPLGSDGRRAGAEAGGEGEDAAQLASGVLAALAGGYAGRAEAAPASKSLQKQVGTPDSLESLDIPSTASSCEGFSPTAFAPPGQPRALDSGYDTENNESPEFVPKEPPEGPAAPAKAGEGPGAAAKNPCRDSAYFSDCDAEAERGAGDGGEDSDGAEEGAGPEEEEEEEDTEDSDESDEELRCYNVQEQSEESEEEPAAVPVVVAESHSARNLRSLLKMPSLLSASFCEDLERKKKAVSFFDDVTIYLFDQESPTRELAEQSFPGVPGPPAAGGGGPAERPSVAEDASDGAVPEEGGGGGFEWDDDFPLAPVKASLMSSLAGTPAEPPPALPALLPAQKQVLPLQFSRFTVSPAPVSRFSITHVSDSDMGSVAGESSPRSAVSCAPSLRAGGSSEDGDRE